MLNSWETDRDVLTGKRNLLGALNGDGSTNTPVSALVYAVNNVGQRTSVTSIGSAFAAPTGWAWGYDALGQVTSATHATQAGFTRGYAYDDIGNRKQSSTGAPGSALTTTYTPNALNQYTAIQPPNPAPAITPTHDFDGNQLTGHRAPLTGAGMVFEWDGENRLKTVKDAGGNVVVSYRYDHGGRRVRKTLAAGSDTAFVYDGWNLVAEYNLASALLTRRHTWGMDLSGSMQGAGGVGGLLATESLDAANLGTWFPTYDGNGNVGEYLDGTGTVAAHFEYDPFGNTLVNTDAANRFPFRFSTKYCDQETGLYFYGYRYYDPLNGRWPSRDPIDEEGGINLYGMVGNDPVNGFDYVGLANCSKYLGLITTLNAQIKANQKASNNLAMKIKERLSEFRENLGPRENPGPLPMRPSPGMKPRDSQMGHIALINKDKASLAVRQGTLRALRQQKGKLWREYNECMATKAAEKGAKVIGKRIGGAAARKVPWILVISFCATTYNEGLGAAANEAVWPVSELWMKAETYPVDTAQYDGEGDQFYLEDNQKVLDEVERFLNDKQSTSQTIKK